MSNTTRYEMANTLHSYRDGSPDTIEALEEIAIMLTEIDPDVEIDLDLDLMD